jgi:ABC-type sugar transport system ATPase subunit
MTDLAGAESGPTTLHATGLKKRFDGLEVLHGVDIEVHAGEVHALVGENGAGKSTVINLLSGRLRPDEGHIELDGIPVEFRNPLAARRAGISVIAQELELVPTMSIVENIFLGVEPTKFGLVRWGDARRRVVSVLRELGLVVDPARVVSTMGVADQQLVEIAKAVIGEFSVLIMDEPTSALNLEDTERLFTIVKRLKAVGVAILYVSHRLWEVFDIADRVTVVRDGNRILTTEISQTNVGAVIRAMLGSKSSLLEEAGRPRTAPRVFAERRPLTLELQGVRSANLLKDITLGVHAGEIVGLAGVLGSGRAELCEAIYGLRKIEAGTVLLRGEPTTVQEPKEALRRGVFLLPEDRKLDGIFGHLDVRENVILNFDLAAETSKAQAPADPSGHLAARSDKTTRGGKLGLAPLRPRAEERAFAAVRNSLSIRCSSPEDRITALSGGNQQKALFARGALAHPLVLLLSEPTRGVDVGAKEEIYSAIEAFAERGIAIVVSSSEISELMRLARRIYVLRNGQIVAELFSEAVREEDILRHMAG